MGTSKVAYAVAHPLLVDVSSIPKVAVASIFVPGFGSGATPAVPTAMVICVLPIVVSIATGLATCEAEFLWNVGLPRTMPPSSPR